jgi:hypothetical protein
VRGQAARAANTTDKVATPQKLAVFVPSDTVLFLFSFISVDWRQCFHALEVFEMQRR